MLRDVRDGHARGARECVDRAFALAEQLEELDAPGRGDSLADARELLVQRATQLGRGGGHAAEYIPVVAGTVEEGETMDGRTVVVLGGGVGGLTAANELRRLLSPQHRVVLIEQEREHRFAPSFLWVMTGARRREQVTLELSTIVHSGVELIQAQVQSIDPERKAVVAGDTEHRYDALVVALGAELDPASFPGYTDAVHGFFDLDGAAGLADALRAFAGGRVIVAVTSLPYKCPAAPYEAALLIEDHLRRRGVRQRSEVAVFTPEPHPMPVAGPVMGAAVSQLLAERGIALHVGHPLASIDARARELVFGD